MPCRGRPRGAPGDGHHRRGPRRRPRRPGRRPRRRLCRARPRRRADVAVEGERARCPQPTTARGWCRPRRFAVIRHALEVAAASGGAFDPTVEPLVRAAGGFGGRAPRARRGRDRELLGPRRPPPRDPGRVDAHGAARRRGAARPRRPRQGRRRRPRARAPCARPAPRAVSWTSGGAPSPSSASPSPSTCATPSAKARPWGAFRLSDAALGTSGGDQQPGHILDPRTGEPARRVLQATRGGRRAPARPTRCRPPSSFSGPRTAWPSSPGAARPGSCSSSRTGGA